MNFFPEYLYRFAFLSLMYEVSSCSLSLSALDIVMIFFFCFEHSNRYVASHCGFNLHFYLNVLGIAFKLGYNFQN